MDEKAERAEQDKRRAAKSALKVALHFHGNWSKYYAGDTAGFDPPQAEKLLGMTMVDQKGNVAKLCTRAGSFLERAGITKGGGEAKPEAEPVGGNPEDAPVKPEETVSRSPKRGRGRS